MDFYRLTAKGFQFLDALQFNNLLLLCAIFFLSFILSIILLIPLKRAYYEDTKKEHGENFVWVFFGLVSYVLCPLSFLALTFVLTEHIVGAFLGIVLYAGVLKLIYYIGNHVGYTISSKE
ncbi:MAG: hypothetical protein ACK5N8_07195 [Alphaproteobacteria bacterium]